MKTFFQFKQFKIYQNDTAFKVGTDGVLLGAWVSCSDSERILDIGTGTGLIAIMLAQRAKAKITGLEISENAYKLLFKNVENCKWNNRISIKNISFQEYAKMTSEKFDLIVSNPPFFSNSLKPTNINLKTAKHTDLLPFSELIDGVVKLLTNKGMFAIILPSDIAVQFIDLCEENKLYCSKEILVKPNINKKPKRVLMEFRKNKKNKVSEILTIETQERHKYTNEYKELIKDYLIKLKTKR